MSGSPVIIGGTGVRMSGSRDGGKFRLVSMLCGWLPAGSTGMMDMFLSKAGGGRHGRAECAFVAAALGDHAAGASFALRNASMFTWWTR
jgi:hypothetical protein